MKYIPIVPFSELTMQQVGDDLIVFDPQEKKAHCLNRVAAYVLRSCDGKLTVNEIASELSKEFEVENEAEALTLLALEELSKAGLVANSNVLIDKTHIDRRNFLKKAITATLAASLVTTILLPPPAAHACVKIGCDCD
jgi:hypothetical protein